MTFFTTQISKKSVQK